MKKHSQKLFFAIMIFFANYQIGTATNYYAAPSATGTGLSIDSPCEITSGFSKLSSPGDTLFLRDGVYYLSDKQSISKTGTENARICIFAYPGETPIIDFRNELYGSSYPGISLHSSSNYMHIKGITIRYAGDNGMINYGNNHIIENCTFYGNCDTGLQHKEGGGNLIKNCDSYANFDYQTGGLSTPDFGGNADGFADKQFSNSNPNIYEGCRAWDNSDDGWDFYQRVGNNEIKNSICYMNGPNSYDMTNHPRATRDATWFANFTTTQLQNYLNYGNGNGFKLGGDYTAHDVTLTNCLAVGNTVRGFDQNNNYGSMTLYNCSSYDNDYRNYGFGNSNGGSLIIKNSVSLNGTNDLNCQSVTSSYNSWNTSGVSCDAADFISLDSTVILTERQSDGSLANIVFMQIADGSDLIDAGTELGLAYSGSAPDLGCYEKGTLNNFPGAVDSPSNKSQSITFGSSIENIVFTWSAGATGLSTEGLPSGITTNTNETSKTLTLSGSPSTTGIFDYTITTVGGSGNPASVSGRIVISSASAKKIAYVTTPDSPSDNLILDKLQSNIDFVVSIEDASTVTDYNAYDLLVLSPAPNSSSAGLVSIEALDKPKLLMKPFQLKDSRWNWGVAANTPEASVTITNTSHLIFTDITLGANNELVLFNSVSTNGVTVITSWINSPTITEIATPVSAAGQAFVEIPVGANMNGTVTTQKLIMLGLSEYSTANLTDDATKLIENTCYYLMGMNIPTDDKNLESSLDYQLTDHAFIVNNEDVEQITIISMLGNIVTNTNENSISIDNLSSGIYIATVKTDKKSFYKKLLIK